jgi:phosphoglycerol transferase MdoB-like AlkP superfamily enzyme
MINFAYISIGMFKKITYRYFLLLLFWIFLFDLHRLIFSFFHFEKLKTVSFLEWVEAFLFSLRLDFAMSAALSVLPILFLSFYLNYNNKALKIIFYSILYIELGLVIIINSGEIQTYEEWNHKLTSRVFKHLANPDEVFRTASWTSTLLFFIIGNIEFIFSYQLLKRMKLIYSNEEDKKSHFVRIMTSFFGFIVLGATSFLLLRGGIQQIPLNINSAIYSNKPVLNDLAINTTYNFSKSFLIYNKTNLDEVIPKMDTLKSQTITSQLYDYKDSNAVNLLNNKKPNIVLVIFEGWGAEAIDCLGQTKGATPNFNRLTKEGYLFENIYAASGTSDIGNATIFSGFPAIPEVSITMQPEKHRGLRTINQDLQKQGYETGYLFGGDLKYGNIGGFLMDHGFQNLVDENNLPAIKRGKLNYYDEDVYQFLINEINKRKKPFFQCVFTGSSHAPYDYPAKTPKKFSGEESEYMNSIIYADWCLGKFIKQVKKQPWYKNTLFIFISDHGHTTPSALSPHESPFFRIPLLFWGPTVKKEFKGIRNPILGAQCDFPYTLLKQLGIKSQSYPWSKNLLSKSCPEFAIHTINKGYGWATPSGNFTYQLQEKLYIQQTFKKEEIRKEEIKAKALLNSFYNYYKKL